MSRTGVCVCVCCEGCVGAAAKLDHISCAHVNGTAHVSCEMPYRVVMDHSTQTPMVIDDDPELYADEETPILDKLLEIDDLKKRHRHLLRMLLFKRAQTQQEVRVAMIDYTDEYSSDAYKRDRFSYASSIEGYTQMDRGTIQLFWEAGSSSRTCDESAR